MGPPLEFCKIFVVYGKDSGLSERDFREHFEKYGDISSINISKQQDGRPKGYTYIGYERTSEACLAMEQMDGQIIGNLRRPLKIHIAHDKRDNLEIDVDQDHMLERLCIKHAKEVDERSIKEYFDQFGRILRVHCLTDKNTRENIGLAFVKYELQSSAARALEECDQVYKPRWADVRRKSALEHDSGMGGGRGGRGGARFEGGFRGGRGGGGGRGYGGDQGMNDDYFGNRQEQPGSGYGMGGGGGNYGMMGQGMGDMDMGFDDGPRRIEAMVPPSLTKQQVFRIFDIAQGLETFTIDANTGMATVEYLDHKSALHAKEKIDGLDVFGQAIAVRLAKPKSGFEETAQQLQQTLATLQTSGGNRNNLDHLVQSIQQVSNALQSQGMQGGGRNMEEMVPWCDVPLPPKQPLLPKNTMQRGKLFIVTVPEAVPNEMLQNAFCRFGDLIICGYQPGKRFGFANFANKEAARRAMNTMHGAVLGGNKMKVEFSRQDKDDTSEMDDSPRKRPRQF